MASLVVKALAYIGAVVVTAAGSTALQLLLRR
jgi:hypothetical protein